MRFVGRWTPGEIISDDKLTEDQAARLVRIGAIRELEPAVKKATDAEEAKEAAYLREERDAIQHETMYAETETADGGADVPAEGADAVDDEEIIVKPKKRKVKR